MTVYQCFGVFESDHGKKTYPDFYRIKKKKKIEDMFELFRGCLLMLSSASTGDADYKAL